MKGFAAHRHLQVEELPARIDCWELARSLEDERYLFLLESGGTDTGLGRNSILAWRPRWEFTAKDGRAHAGPPGETRPLAGEVLTELERTLAACSLPVGGGDAETAMPPAFSGGAIGFFAYELLHEIEAIAPNAAPDLGIADCHLLFCDAALVTEEASGRSWILANGWGSTAAESREDCRAELEAIRSLCAETDRSLVRSPASERGPRRPAARAARPARRERLEADELERHGVRPVTDRGRYLELVRRAREHIFAGDVYELCLTQRFDADFDGSGIDLYGAMRAVNPAPMGAYLRFPELEILSCSPERFLRVDAQRWVETRPLKGTRPRGRTAREDRALELDLATAAKDAAENVMIVDVARNDLGRVCELATVTVPSLRAVERHPSVFQLSSTIRGRLRDDVTAVRLLRATFPGGSMTGAPKVAAMRLIAELEDSRRGVFAGAIGYVNYSGELDLSIAIRGAIKRGKTLSLHAGGAVTSDSAAGEEYQETLDKLSALVRALQIARAEKGAPHLVTPAVTPSG
jgi:anthranilate/para-aminobenzoate synthase component I